MKTTVWMTLMALMFALLMLPALAFAHGAAQITVSPDTIAPGGMITVNGSKLGMSAAVKLSLEGLTYRAPLGIVQTDANEALKADFTIPVDAPEGEYQVKALTADGDAVAADLTITPPPPSSAAVQPAMPAPGQPTMQPSGQAPGQAPMPSVLPHELARPRTPLETTGLFAAVAVAAGLGLMLILRK